MAKKSYCGINNIARNIPNTGYCGVNDVARRLVKGYIGDSQGVARQFWGGSFDKFLKLNFEDDSIGTHIYTVADPGLTARYAMEQYDLTHDGWIYPVFIKNLRKNMSGIVNWVRAKIPSDALCVITVLTRSGSGPDSAGWIEVEINYQEAGTYDTQITIGAGNIENGYRSFTYTLASNSWKRWTIFVKVGGTEYPSSLSPSTVSPGNYNFIGSRGNMPNISSDGGIVCNLGVYFTEYELPEVPYYRPQDYLLYWNFNLNQSKMDYNRNIYLKTDNQIMQDAFGNYYISTTITLPRWLGSHLFADVGFEFALGGQLKLYKTINEQTGAVTYYDTVLFRYRDSYYFDVHRTVKVDDAYKAYGVWRFFQTNLDDEEYEWEDHGINSFSFNVSYEGKVLNELIDFNYHPFAQTDIQMGNDVGSNPKEFGLRVYSIGVKRTPFDPKDIYFYARYNLQYSPEGTSIQYTYVRGSVLTDFDEYLGTNKSFYLTEDTSGVWLLDTRNFGDYARRYIRSPGRTTPCRLFIPINPIENASGKYIRFSARTYNNSSTYSAGVAYINNGTLTVESIAYGDIKGELNKYGGRITSPRVDYIWIDDNGDNRTIMTSCIKISDTEQEAFH